MVAMDDVVHARSLVDAAKEAGMDVVKVRECPLFHKSCDTTSSFAGKLSCSDCVALETSLTCQEGDDDGSVQGEQPSLRNGEQGQSKQPSPSCIWENSL